METKKDKINIAISRKQYEYIAQFGKYGQTFSDCVSKLIDEYNTLKSLNTTNNNNTNNIQPTQPIQPTQQTQTMKPIQNKQHTK